VQIVDQRHQDGQVWTLGYSFVCNVLESIVALASTSLRSLNNLSFNWLCCKWIIQIRDTDEFWTQVRSITLDTWLPDQVAFMKCKLLFCI
jgi:hypothetical protein